MLLFSIALISSAGILGGWFHLNPACPSCGSRKWDRRLCRPLLLCRRCAQRIDRHGTRQN